MQQFREVSRTVQTNIDSEQWFEHFKGVCVSECATEAHAEVVSDEVITDDKVDAPTSAQEVDGATRRLKPRKDAGVDGILNEMLKSIPFRPITGKLFCQVWKMGVFPKDWMKSIIAPLHERGKTDDPDIYRGISLTSMCVYVCACVRVCLRVRVCVCVCVCVCVYA